MITLVLGGARSGKSNFAQQLASDNQSPVLYIATATVSDREMAERIAHHQQNRPSEWRVHESPLDLISALTEEGNKQQTILVDCLTLWLNNQLFSFPEQNFEQLFHQLISASRNCSAPIIFVSNEVGLGIIPMGNISRKFVDEAGRLNQKIAQVANQVFFIAAGLPLVLKNEK
ncbi:MAG: bifunctional adenosylcobinamide kinase/adenosylcobinamide-phosphate guanylyltransferase [Pseudomonadota bacterium]